MTIKVRPTTLSVPENDRPLLDEFDRLHQEVFDLLQKLSGMPGELLQPKAGMDVHSHLVYNYLWNKSLDYLWHKPKNDDES